MRRPHVVSVALLALGTALASVAIAAPASAVPAGLQYVALGDSYAAGFGLEVVPGTPSVPSPPSPAAGCLENEADYPRQVAAALGLSLTDVTCTGAVTANITTVQQQTASYFGGGTAALQIDALSPDTDVVTVSIGGNDAGFSAIAQNCIASGPDGPTVFTGSPPAQTCEDYYTANPTQNPAVLIPTTVATSLAATFAAIGDAAPNARVFVVGYPFITPDDANTPAGPDGCFTPLFDDYTDPAPPYPVNSVPFARSDVRFIHSLEVLLNDTIAAAAATAGFTFIDNHPGSVAHSVCPQSGTPYVNGITWRGAGTLPLTVNGALHPNAAGVSFLTGQVVPAIAAAFPDPAPVPVPQPAALPATGVDVGPTAVLVAASVLMMAAGAVTMVRARRRTGTAKDRR